MSYKLLARKAIAESKGQRYAVDDSVRAARGVAGQLFDLRRRKADADQRVDAALDRLQRVDVGALQAELADALVEQEAIAKQIAALDDRKAA
ncbi:hypothetical protein SAMN05216573_102591 [Bradyrhizobium sp. Rc3b]|uniref:hypothetical protein n=1 Tax=Bradyrhizobium sp. Rc3b TaxID=1855322 RepID=UPI0008E2A115|nr:hypothetical protein [Bradyrhizobium sp. Rc3b]SFM56984.1 hypothetical protein SAMN05216573_102591 [Bradyrhizobium sp. Rc3b]